MVKDDVLTGFSHMLALLASQVWVGVLVESTLARMRDGASASAAKLGTNMSAGS